MQPDGSYQIQVLGNGYASLDQTKAEAYRRASFLCPKGYEMRGEIPNDAFKPNYTLIVMCK